MNLKNTNFDAFRIEVALALKEVAEKYGCDVNLGKIKYDENEIDIAIEFHARGDNGESGEQALFNRICSSYGFKPEHYNKSFVLDKGVYKLVGFNPKARKYHCIIADESGNKYTAGIESVQRCLGII
jgi:hypothetical protein